MAWHLGYANPEHMEATIPSHVLDEWTVFLAKEPRGEYRADWHAAQGSWAAFESMRTEGQRDAVRKHLITFQQPENPSADDDDAGEPEAAIKAFFDSYRR